MLERLDRWSPRATKSLLVLALAAVLLGSFMRETRVERACAPEDVCLELLVTGGTTGQIMFALAPVFLGAALLLAAFSRHRAKRTQSRESSPSVF